MASPLAERVERTKWLEQVPKAIADVCRLGFGKVLVTVADGAIVEVRKEIIARQPQQLNS